MQTSTAFVPSKVNVTHFVSQTGYNIFLLPVRYLWRTPCLRAESILGVESGSQRFPCLQLFGSSAIQCFYPRGHWLGRCAYNFSRRICTGKHGCSVCSKVRTALHLGRDR